MILMANDRKILRVIKAKSTMEGAGVRLKRVFGNQEISLLDPFLLLDDFHSDNPNDYIAGFPSHPHRGIETVTYMIAGNMKHEDSIGNKGVIQSGDVQWMTAGNGIIHSEMPEQTDGLMWGFQLWCNLPEKSKMMNPGYQEITEEQIPEIAIAQTSIKVIAGTLNGIKGPVQDIVIDPEYLDVSISEGTFVHNVKAGYTVFAYILEGEGYFDQNQDQVVRSEQLVLFSDGIQVVVQATEKPLRFLLISGKPIKEPVAWYGPIVMNTEDELKLAFEEYRNGTFLKHQ